MAGNANSGNKSAGKNLGQLMQSAIIRAIKQSKHQIGCRSKSLDILLADAMQEDPLGFLRAVAPYVPKELFIDSTINVAHILQEAQARVIHHMPLSVAAQAFQALPLIVEDDAAIAQAGYDAALSEFDDADRTQD